MSAYGRPCDRFVGESVGLSQVRGFPSGQRVTVRCFFMDELQEPFDFEEEKIIGGRERSWFAKPE